MVLFKDMLHSDQTIFKNQDALDTEFIPKILPYREKQQRYIALCIAPLLQDRTGKNLLICGTPGIGKTATIKYIFKDLENETDDVIPIYINCWQKNTTFKIIVAICEELGYKFTQNKRTEELFTIIKNMLNKKSVVFAFDEIDKIEDFDFVYTVLEEIYKKTILLITNYKEWLSKLDERIRSRLGADIIEFQAYDLKETRDILKQRINYAFYPSVFESDALDVISKKTFETKDIRTGLHLMKEAGIAAENESCKKIEIEHANKALQKIDDFSIKKSADLESQTRLLLEIIKENPAKKSGELFEIYQQKGGSDSYRSFHRKLKSLETSRFITIKRIEGGKEGKTSIIEYNSSSKKLTEF
ncbi:MAG: AAA family ATPase [Nanoarchaeota archaeon]|nr:AAA family ATPase [Nanoarchaeota archaeon]